MRRLLLAVVVALTAATLPALAETPPQPPPPPVLAADERGAGPFTVGQSPRIGVAGSFTGMWARWVASHGGAVYAQRYDGPGDLVATVTPRVASGRYRLDSLSVQTPSGFWDYHRSGNLYGSGGGQSSSLQHDLDMSVADFDVDNDAVDVTAPVITSIPTGTIRVRPGGRLAFDVEASDDQSGVSYVSHGFYTDGYSNYLSWQYGDGRTTATGYRVDITLSAAAEPGRYALRNLGVHDRNGNQTYYAEDGRTSTSGVTGTHALPLSSLVVVVDPEAPVGEGPAGPDGPRVGGPLTDGTGTAVAVSVDTPTTPVRYGLRARVTGRATDAEGAGVAGAKVTVTGRRGSGPAYLLGHARAGADGVWSFAFVPYRSVTAVAAVGSASAPSAPVTVARDVALTVAPRQPVARTPFTLTAHAAPARAGSLLRLERRLPTGDWVPVAVGRQDSSGRAAFDRLEPVPGGAVYRAVAPADEAHADGSAEASVVVG